MKRKTLEFAKLLFIACMFGFLYFGEHLSRKVYIAVFLALGSVAIVLIVASLPFSSKREKS